MMPCRNINSNFQRISSNLFASDLRYVVQNALQQKKINKLILHQQKQCTIMITYVRFVVIVTFS